MCKILKTLSTNTKNNLVLTLIFKYSARETVLLNRVIEKEKRKKLLGVDIARIKEKLKFARRKNLFLKRKLLNKRKKYLKKRKTEEKKRNRQKMT